MTDGARKDIACKSILLTEASGTIDRVVADALLAGKAEYASDTLRYQHERLIAGKEPTA